MACNQGWPSRPHGLLPGRPGTGSRQGAPGIEKEVDMKKVLLFAGACVAAGVELFLLVTIILAG